MSGNPQKNTTDQSFEKLEAYFLTICKEKPFLDRVQQIRKACGIPPEGYMDMELDNRRSHLYESGVSEKIQKHTTALAKEYKLNLPFWEDIFWLFITDGLADCTYAKRRTAILLRDMPEEKMGIVDNKVWRDFNEAEDEFYPVYLMLSPYTTRRDLDDYIKKNWSSHIEKTLRKYKGPDSKIGRVRIKPSEQVSNFIYNNKDLPHQKIVGLVKKHFSIDMDVGHVGKVISLEKKRRKEV